MTNYLTPDRLTQNFRGWNSVPKRPSCATRIVSRVAERRLGCHGRRRNQIEVRSSRKEGDLLASRCRREDSESKQRSDRCRDQGNDLWSSQPLGVNIMKVSHDMSDCFADNESPNSLQVSTQETMLRLIAVSKPPEPPNIIFDECQTPAFVRSTMRLLRRTPVKQLIALVGFGV
jgi:hypothetical protein